MWALLAISSHKSWFTSHSFHPHPQPQGSSCYPRRDMRVYEIPMNFCFSWREGRREGGGGPEAWAFSSHGHGRLVVFILTFLLIKVRLGIVGIQTLELQLPEDERQQEAAQRHRENEDERQDQ